MAIGFNVAFTYNAGTWTPVVRVSTANDLTMGSGATAVSLPWVENSHSGSADTTSLNLKTAVMACSAAMYNRLAASGVPI